MRWAQRGAMGLCPAVRPRPCPFGVPPVLPPLGTHDPKQSPVRAVFAFPIRVCCASCTLGQGLGIPAGPPPAAPSPRGAEGRAEAAPP